LANYMNSENMTLSPSRQNLRSTEKKKWSKGFKLKR
jgi:hypothetical protein